MRGLAAPGPPFKAEAVAGAAALVPGAAAERARAGLGAAVMPAAPAGLSERGAKVDDHGLAAAGAQLAWLGGSFAQVLRHHASWRQTGQRRRAARCSTRSWLLALASW